MSFDRNFVPNAERQLPSDRRDPNALPQHIRRDRFATFKHDAGPHGMLYYDRFTLAVQRWQGYMGRPVDLPQAFKGVPQPLVATCSRPGPGNRGCPSANGCQYVGEGPFKVIATHQDVPTLRTSFDCFIMWCGFTEEGLPNQQEHAQIDGFLVDVNTRTVPYVTTRAIKNEDGSGWRRLRYAGEYEIKNLGPMYNHLPPANPMPEVCIGEVPIPEALAKFKETRKDHPNYGKTFDEILATPTKQEVMLSGGNPDDVD